MKEININFKVDENLSDSIREVAKDAGVYKSDILRVSIFLCLPIFRAYPKLVRLIHSIGGAAMRVKNG